MKGGAVGLLQGARAESHDGLSLYVAREPPLARVLALKDRSAADRSRVELALLPRLSLTHLSRTPFFVRSSLSCYYIILPLRAQQLTSMCI